ncbi:DUF1697 domain-containing protein [Pseudalkalibacillus hwajinpoensis]|uniref:DUF1697 domain-containing protein n=1 Tax=Guptibacillus hwajinpoensis TaxID=208199 RepID=UPI00325BD025
MEQIEEQIKETFGLTVPVILRTSNELKQIKEHCPFNKEEISNAEASSVGESLYVSLLSERPSEEAVKQLPSYSFENEAYQINGREIYLLSHDSIRNSKLTIKLNKLRPTATVRNWKTINKLLDMVTSIKQA